MSPVIKLKKIIELALKCTFKGNHIFYSYSGHINELDVRIYEGEWKVQKDALTVCIDLNGTRIMHRKLNTVVKILEYMLENNTFHPMFVRKTSKREFILIE